MKRALLAAAVFCAALIGSLDVGNGDLRFNAAGHTLRHWDWVSVGRPACAVGLTPSGGFPCGSAAPGAGSYTMTGPASGTINQAGTFTDTASGATSAVATPSDGGHGGVFSPTAETLGAAPTTFTYTPLQAGTWTISSTNNGSLTDPAGISYTSPNAASTPRSSWIFGSNQTDTFSQPDPFGGSNGVLMTENNAASDYHKDGMSFTFNAGQNFTGSLYVKNNSGSRGMELWIGASDSSYAAGIAINPASCAVVTAFSWGGAIINSTAVRTANLGAGWCLAQMNFSLPGTNDQIQLFMTDAPGGNEVYSGDGVSSILTYGPMVQ